MITGLSGHLRQKQLLPGILLGTLVPGLLKNRQGHLRQKQLLPGSPGVLVVRAESEVQI